VAKASPTLHTMASPRAGRVGKVITSVKDTATFRGTTTVAPPTGNVSFTLYSDNTCSTAVAGVGGSGAIRTTDRLSSARYSTNWTPPVVGTYYWIASYAGDANNNGFTTGCGDAKEQITIRGPGFSELGPEGTT
jgi:hypothetical protein